jgi:hypothetical protein
MKRIPLALLAISIVGCSATVETNTETLPPIAIEPVVSTVVITTPPTTTTTTIPIDWAGIAASIELGISEARALYGKCGEWHDLAIEVGFKEEDWKTLSRIIYRESRCQPDAWNGHDAGLVQINQIHTEWVEQSGWNYPEDMFIPEHNLKFALMLQKASGWKPWRYIQ